MPLITCVLSAFNCAAFRSWDSFLHCFADHISHDSTEPDEPPAGATGGRRRRGVTYVFQAIALVVLEQPVLATVVPVAEAAVADDALGALPAVFVGAADLLGRHAAQDGVGQVQRRLPLDMVVGQRPGRREVLAGVDEAEVGLGARRPHGEEGREVPDGEVLMHGEGECWERAFVRTLASYWGGGRGKRLTVAGDILDEDLDGLRGGGEFWRGGSRHDECFGDWWWRGSGSRMKMLGGGNVV